MFCSSCGRQIGDTAKFCPHCGTVTTNYTPPIPTAAPVPVEPEASPQPASGKGFPKLAMILSSVAAVLVIALAAVLCLLNTPTAKVTRALNKSIAAYTDAVNGLNISNFSELSQRQSYSDSMTLELNGIGGKYADQVPSGIGVRYEGAHSLPQRDISMTLTPYYGAVDLLTLEAAIQDSCVYFRIPEILGSDYYGVNTTTLGADLVRQDRADPNLASFGFNFFDLTQMVAELTQPSEEAIQELANAGKALSKEVSVKKADPADLNINGSSTKCAGYLITIPQQAAEDYLLTLEHIVNRADHKAIYQELFTAMGIPQEAVASFLEESDVSAVFEPFREFEEILQQIGDIQLQVYLSDGYVSAILWPFETDGQRKAVCVYLGGGSAYADDLSLTVSVDGVNLTLSSSGNHTGTGGRYTDTTILEATAEGTSHTVFISQWAYLPDSSTDNFQWSVTAEAYSVEATGQLDMEEDSFYMELEDICLYADDSLMASLSLEYALKEYTPLLTVDSSVMILELSEEENTRLSAQISGNILKWMYGLIRQIPALEQSLYQFFSP